ncbi:protein CANDIDATE G-PROTEIN COUPLED RECEPTOR 7-like [Rutidosis leptorrhynchoides]|uniref:protein CANDIDATE G-PROTEIN COUPLED RECEPTOR 7-like n=1 Tax=Rutidosis leptorrhynchoides TaxID=125765 RepID=UPI003A99F50C
MGPHQFFIFFTLLITFTATAAEIRFTRIRSDSRSTVPLDEFGFTHFGRLHLNITQISFSPPEPDLSRIGFFLSTRDSIGHVIEQLQSKKITCPLDSSAVKTIFTFNHLKPTTTTPSYDAVFNVTDADQFTLVFANCAGDNVKVNVNVISVMYNVNPRNNHRDYLSAGKTNLPTIYFLLFLIYAALIGVWIYTLYIRNSSVFRIHYFMLAVLLLKALNLLCETEDKSYIKRSGSPHGWDVLFYIFSFLKGITLFTLIVLIGTGWSFLKPYLQDKEKKVLMIVIPLQVVANVAQVVIDETGPFGQDSDTWRQVFLLVDIVCCCAVLFPIIWSIKKLREAATTDGKAAVNLMKLTLFRQYYVVVICYIYFTRVAVYVLETITSYRYAWTSVLAAEMATLAFYVFTGYNFRPTAYNPYFAIDDDEEEAAVEALKYDDEFEL